MKVVMSGVESNCTQLGSKKRLLASCTLVAVADNELCIKKAGASCFGDANHVPCLWHADRMPNITISTDEDILSSHVSFDTGNDCIEWSFFNERDSSDNFEHLDESLFDSDGASLYLAVQQSKRLECNHENQPLADEVEFENFDPCLYIKQLPDLSEMASPCCSILLPRPSQRSPLITLVLDLDETLVHSTLEKCDAADFTFPVKFNHQEHTVYVHCRPYLKDFLERIAQMFEIVVFTASQCIYAEQLLDILDPGRKMIQHRVYRDSCIYIEGNYLKDLTVLGRDLAKVAIVDNCPQAFGLQVDNGIPIESWFDDRTDSELLNLLPFLEILAGVDDVRPVIAKRFSRRGRLDAPAALPPVSAHGDPFRSEAVKDSLGACPL